MDHLQVVIAAESIGSVDKRERQTRLGSRAGITRRGEGRNKSASFSSRHSETMTFGPDFLNTPFDVAVIGHDSERTPRLAISDFGALHIVTHKGVHLQTIPVPGNVSSIAFCESSQRLFASVFHRGRARLIYVYNTCQHTEPVETNGRIASSPMLELCNVLRCPCSPPVALCRTRWLAVTDDGQLFVLSSDVDFSAIWALDQLTDTWMLIMKKQKVHYTHLSLVERHPDPYSVALITVDTLKNAVRMLYVDTDTLRVSAEFDLSIAWGLGSIKNPIAAATDGHGNLIVLDFDSGTVFQFVSMPNASSAGFGHLKIVFDVGPKSAYGLRTENGWCYAVETKTSQICCFKYMDQ